jgi:uncharacterized protein YjiS (DUF1127 family)
MSHYFQGGTTAAFAARRPVRRPFIYAAAETVRTWSTRWRQRRELLDYMAFDHRAADDAGLIGNDANDWATRPFWRA